MTYIHPLADLLIRGWTSPRGAKICVPLFMFVQQGDKRVFFHFLRKERSHHHSGGSIVMLSEGFRENKAGLPRGFNTHRHSPFLRYRLVFSVRGSRRGSNKNFRLHKQHRLACQFYTIPQKFTIQCSPAPKCLISGERGFAKSVAPIRDDVTVPEATGRIFRHTALWCKRPADAVIAMVSGSR